MSSQQDQSAQSERGADSKDFVDLSENDVTSHAESICKVKVKSYKSEIWGHFTKVLKDPSNLKDYTANCNYCKRMSYGSTTATTTLRGHLDRCLSYPYNKVYKKQKTLESFKTEEGESKLISWSFNENKCREALAKMIIIDELPFSFIEGEGFKLFCDVAVPRMKIVSRVTIAQDILKIYAHEKKQLKGALTFNAHRVCLTTDTWTSVQNLCYMVLTAHFIDRDWKLRKRILNFCTISSHKGVDIGNAIESCMIEWGIQKVFTLTVDNASSNDTAVAHMKKKLSKKNSFVLDGDFFHMRCCAHILNLIARDGMKEERGSIESIRSAVRYIRGSPQRTELFKTCCQMDENPYKHNLVLDVSTRWNYTFHMLERALKFQKSFERFDELDPHYSLELREKVPGENDWNNARILTKFLKTFHEVTLRLSGSLYVTANTYFHDVMTIQSSILSWSNSLDTTLRAMAVKMIEKFNKYWGDLDKMNMLLLVAVVLDPCFKLKYVIFCYSKIYPKEVVDKLEHKLKETLNRLYAYYQVIHNSNQPSKDVDNAKKNNESVQVVVDDQLVSFEDDFMTEENMGGSKTEIDLYLEEVRIKKPVGQSFDILNWWKLNSARFPILALMARDVLAIPVSTVASESAFSTGGRVLDQFRSSLSPKVVEALICAQDWLRASAIPIENIEEQIKEVVALESTIANDPDLACAFTSVVG